MMRDNTIQIFIMSHNRPQFVVDALNSVLSQSYKNFFVTISDNSTNDLVEKALNNASGPNLRYLRRNPPLTSYEHFHCCVDEVSAPYLMLFHDDDILEPEYIAEAMNVFAANPDVVAVGCGYAYIDVDGRPIENSPFKRNGGVRIFDCVEDFFMPYLTYSAKLAPYCSYVFKSDAVCSDMFDLRHGGKYSDCSTIAKLILNGGRVAWIERPFVKIRLHSGQDVRTPDIHGRLSLLRFIYASSSIRSDSQAALLYRRIAWCDWLKFSWRENIFKHPRRYCKILKIMLPYLIKNKLHLL